MQTCLYYYSNLRMPFIRYALFSGYFCFSFATHYLAEISASPAAVGRGSARRAYPLVVHIPVGKSCAGGGGGGGRRQGHHLLKMPFMSILYNIF
jgi:hypothetical protein